ncbi:MAG: 1-(5-phosphoribosyl)-5-[(5-phosphoribosylamino)methylideneamino]imidazole-4-carboxamide isomerase [bacterium]|nr:1-(5-phosphoribosyl)-5-[(5-phosphoribosylamino)methylideneamino]imidazole-4-carboxamide isomerase [bacterium]
MIIIPAIDISNGRCVRLEQGKAERLIKYSDYPLEVAKKWEKEGAVFLHIVDLDGAFKGFPAHFDMIAGILKRLNIPAEIGGGIRNMDAIENYLAAGAGRVVLGTSACDNMDFIRDVKKKFPGRVIVSVDAKDGFVVKKGWVEKSSVTALDFIKLIKKAGFDEIIYTDISKDGMLTGPNIEACRRIMIEGGIKIIASGGIGTLEDIKKLRELSRTGINGVIIGKALYDGRFSLKEALEVADAC